MPAMEDAPKWGGEWGVYDGMESRAVNIRTAGSFTDRDDRRVSL